VLVGQLAVMTPMMCSDNDLRFAASLPLFCNAFQASVPVKILAQIFMVQTGKFKFLVEKRSSRVSGDNFELPTEINTS
jgi:hypothetical protein